MDASQAIREYFAKLDALVATFDFTRAGAEESMGKDAAHIVGEGILDRSIQEQGGPDGAWLANDPDYTDWKREHYNVDLIGVRTGQMFSLPSLLGDVDIQPMTVTIRYGTGLPPTSSMASSYLSQEDTSITDTEKAWIFTRKKGAFFVLDVTIAGNVRDYFAAELLKFIRELNAL